MRNSYEFKVEEINEIIICNKNSNNFTTIWRRSNDIPKDQFIETYSADPDENGKYICVYCGAWNVDNADENHICEKCGNQSNVLIHENDAIDCVMELMSPEDFHDNDIYINGILIK